MILHNKIKNILFLMNIKFYDYHSKIIEQKFKKKYLPNIWLNLQLNQVQMLEHVKKKQYSVIFISLLNDRTDGW